jgi:cation diffusion facilitator family transporter
VIEDIRIRVALFTLLITFTVLTLRIFAYFLSGSLAILADSFHSFTDIIAGILAVISLRVAIKEPDLEHPYGHGKAESLGTLGISLALVAIFVYILYEAFHRFFQIKYEIEFGELVAFFLVLTIMIDYWRSKVLLKYSKKFSSQILEADALHYKSDFYATLSILILSLVVYFSIIKGSIVLYLDSILGISISFYFAIAGLKLANRAINELMDRAPIEAIKFFERTCEEFGIRFKNTRARRVGNKVFIDSTIILPEKLSIEEAHDFANKIEEKIKYYLKDEKLDITIHMETEESEKRSEIMKRVGDIAKETKGVIGVHDISVIKEKDQYHIRLHVEVSPTVTLKEAGLIGKNIEEKIRTTIKEVESVIAHVEPRRVSSYDVNMLVLNLINKDPRLKNNVKLLSVKTLDIENKVIVDIKCLVKGNLNVEESHRLITILEGMIREELGSNCLITINYSSEY